MNAIEKFKQELIEMDLETLYTETDIIDTATGEVVAKGGDEISDENLDRVLWLVLEDEESKYCIIDNGVFLATEFKAEAT